MELRNLDRQLETFRNTTRASTETALDFQAVALAFQRRTQAEALSGARTRAFAGVGLVALAMTVFVWVRADAASQLADVLVFGNSFVEAP
jgi:hypothetical protein